MKQYIFYLIIISVLPFNLKAQKLYFSLFGIYSIPAASNSISDNNFDYYSTMRYTETAAKFSLGSGIALGFRIGYMFSKKVGCEIGTNYSFQSRKFDCGSTNFYFNTNDIYAGSIYAKNIFSIQPCLRYLLSENKISLFFRLGLNMPIQQKIIMENTFLVTSSNNTSYIKKELTGSFSLGIAGGFGVNYQLNSKIGLFSEVNFVVQSIYVSKAIITEYKSTIGGVKTDVLSTLTTNQKETNYTTNVSKTYSSNSNPNNPQQQTTYSIPFSSIGLAFGIAYQIDKTH